MKQDALLVKYPYRCKVCGWLYWLAFDDIMLLTDSIHMPCTHNWLELTYAFDLDGQTAPESEETTP